MEEDQVSVAIQETEVARLRRINAAQTDLIVRQAREIDRLRAQVESQSKRIGGLQVMASISTLRDEDV